MVILTGEATLLFLPPFSEGLTLQGKNLLLKKQSLSFKNRPHVPRATSFNEQQTRIHASYCGSVFGKEAGGVK